MQGVEDFLRLDMMVAAGGGDSAGVADCVEDTVFFGCCDCFCWCWQRTSARLLLKGSHWGESEPPAVDSGRWAESKVPACEREGDNRLTGPAQHRLCSGVTRSMAVSATDVVVMRGHHDSSDSRAERDRENYMLMPLVKHVRDKHRSLCEVMRCIHPE